MLKLSDISGNVSEVFKIMKLNKVFEIYKTEEKAIKAFDKKGWFG
jgi:anti-sigma B factor antagonist